MKKTIPPILPETFEVIVRPWLVGIARKDIVAVMSYPASDRQRRLLNLMDDRMLQRKYWGKPDQYLWVTVDFRVDPVDNTNELEALILHRVAERFRPARHLTANFGARMGALWRRYHKKVVIAAIGAEALLARHNTALLIWLTVMMRSDIVRMLLFFETNLFAHAAIDIFGRVPAFQPRIATMRLYSPGDTLQFIRHMEHEWRFRVPDETKHRIVTACGGLLLLVKEALWFLRDHPQRTKEDMFRSTEMRFNLLTFWQGLDKDCQPLIDHIVKKEPIDAVNHRPSIDYLVQTGLLLQKRTTFALTVPLVAQFRRDVLNQGTTLTLDEHGSIVVEGVNVSAQFSRAQRRVLAYLLQHPNEIVSRDTAAERIWPGNTAQHYSDWAIDSHISRLRQRLTSLGVDTTLLKTVKRKGFHFRKNTL